MERTPERRRFWERCMAAVAAADPEGVSLWTLAAMSEDLGVTAMGPSQVAPRLGAPSSAGRGVEPER